MPASRFVSLRIRRRTTLIILISSDNFSKPLASLGDLISIHRPSRECAMPSANLGSAPHCPAGSVSSPPAVRCLWASHSREDSPYIYRHPHRRSSSVPRGGQKASRAGCDREALTGGFLMSSSARVASLRQLAHWLRPDLGGRANVPRLTDCQWLAALRASVTRQGRQALTPQVTRLAQEYHKNAQDVISQKTVDFRQVPVVTHVCPHPRYPVYVVPRAEGKLVVGATSIESDDRSEGSVRGALELLSSAYSMLPALAETRILEFNTQVRPAPPDNRPAFSV